MKFITIKADYPNELAKMLNEEQYADYHLVNVHNDGRHYIAFLEKNPSQVIFDRTLELETFEEIKSPITELKKKGAKKLKLPSEPKESKTK